MTADDSGFCSVALITVSVFRRWLAQPPIDTCTITFPETPGNKWSTLMSLCNHCAGETNNILNTYGGVFVVPGDPSDVQN